MMNNINYYNPNYYYYYPPNCNTNYYYQPLYNYNYNINTNFNTNTFYNNSSNRIDNNNRSNNFTNNGRNYNRKTICGVCNVYFNNEKQFLDHINDLHITCNYENCNFSAPLSILEIHKLKHVKNEEGKTIDSKDEIKKWINSRIKNFPKHNSSDSTTNDLTSQENKGNNFNSQSNNTKIINKDGIVGKEEFKNGEINGKGPELEEMSILERYLRSKMNNGRFDERNSKKSIVFPYLNKIYKQPSALVRYTNPVKYEQMLKRLESVKSPYSYKSSIYEINKFKNGVRRNIYSVPIRPPAVLQLIRSDVEKLDNSVVNIIKYIVNNNFSKLI